MDVLWNIFGVCSKKREKSEISISLGEKHIYTLCFEDDNIVLARNKDDKYITRKLTEEYHK